MSLEPSFTSLSRPNYVDLRVYSIFEFIDKSDAYIVLDFRFVSKCFLTYSYNCPVGSITKGHDGEKTSPKYSLIEY